MTSPAEDVADILDAATLGFSCFIGRNPDNTTLAVTVYDAGGNDPNPRWARDFPIVKILVSGAVQDYAGAYQTAISIKNYLLGLAPVTVGTKIYASFTMQGDIQAIGYSEKDCPLFTMRLKLIVDNADVGNRDSL